MKNYLGALIVKGTAPMMMLEISVMQIPENAVAKPFTDATLGSLLVGLFKSGESNFFAVRAERQDGTGIATPSMVILSAWVDDQDLPYLCDPAVGTPTVLDLGGDWSVDVSIDKNLPTFIDGPGVVLIRSDKGSFICLNDRQGYLDLAKGIVIDNPVDGAGKIACWPAFEIYLPQPGVDGPGAKIFSWPRK